MSANNQFTGEQIKAAHAKVKSGADYPAYVKEITALGVTGYETYVTDGHTDYYGKDNYKVSLPEKYSPLIIADKSNKAQFAADLKAHQQGKTDYPRFCADCAASGVEKWVVSVQAMTCTYYDKAGNMMLEETIPSI